MFRSKTSRAMAASAVAAVALGLSTTASAASFLWSYAGEGGYLVNASGSLTANPLGGGDFQVTSITGTRNGAAITGLTAYAVQDNQVYTTDPHLDFLGLAFNVGAVAYNVYFDSSSTGGYNCGRAGYCEVGPGVTGSDGISDPTGQIAFTLTSVPEPAAWALMLAGFGLAGAAVRRRRQVPA